MVLTRVFALGLKPAFFLLLTLPLLWLVWQAWGQQLGANPIEAITHELGHWALRLLLLTLSLHPLQRLTGWRWPMALRRMVGLFSFFYAVLHLLAYVVLDQFFDWQTILADLIERPYITIGMSCLLLLLPLALTSNRAMIKRMGKNWGRLHRLIYPAAILAVLHYALLLKVPGTQLYIYIGALFLLLLIRLPFFLARRHSSR